MEKVEKYLYSILIGIAFGFATNSTGPIKGAMVGFGVVMFCAFLSSVISTKK